MTVAFADTSRMDDARAVSCIAANREVAAPRPTVSNIAMTGEVGLPVCEAIVAFAEGRYEDTIGLLTRFASPRDSDPHPSSEPQSAPAIIPPCPRWSRSGSRSDKASPYNRPKLATRDRGGEQLGWRAPAGLRR